MANRIVPFGMATTAQPRAKSARAKRTARDVTRRATRRTAVAPTLRRSASPLDTFRAIEKGFPVSTLAALSRESGISEAKLKSLARISSSTFARRQKSGRFSPEESDRLHRIRRVTQAAAELFDGDADSGKRWLEGPARAFDGAKPIDLLASEYGAQQVEALIHCISHGVYT
jgi:putative toxin-antitoxin system antitoxin component (TIGR02293 family)